MALSMQKQVALVFHATSVLKHRWPGVTGSDRALGCYMAQPRVELRWKVGYCKYHGTGSSVHPTSPDWWLSLPAWWSCC